MIHISLLGSVRVLGGNGSIAEMQTRRGIELFAFLVLEDGRSFERAHLVEQFWGQLPEDCGRRAASTKLRPLSLSLSDVGMDTNSAFLRGLRGGLFWPARHDG